MLIFGFKLKRFREWLDVVDEEQRDLLWLDRLKMLWKMARSAFQLGGVSRSEWRRKMRCCPKCPVFDRTMRRCRPFTGHGWGCGCYVPFLALSEQTCYADQYLKERNWGWNKTRTMT